MRFKLIAGFINPDITEAVVKTAKEAGATGEVIIQGKGSGMEKTSFLGLTIQDRTDIVLFVVEKKKKKKIIEAISAKCEIEKPGNGVLIELSIDKVAGLDKQIKHIRENLKSEQL